MLPRVPFVKAVRIAPHEWIDDCDSDPHLAVDLYLDVDHEAALPAFQEASELLESLEAEAGVTVGSSVIVPHGRVNGTN